MGPAHGSSQPPSPEATPPNNFHPCPSDISPSYHRLGIVEGLRMRARHLVSPKSHCFRDQKQLRRCQPEKYNLRAGHLAGSRELLPWQCLASFNSSTSLSLVTSTLRHTQHPVSSPYGTHTCPWQVPSVEAKLALCTLLPSTDTHTHTLSCSSKSTPRQHSTQGIGSTVGVQTLRQAQVEACRGPCAFQRS